ncbi:MAG: mitochondrial peripheral inner membrane protein [Watsoniomyces obsoletus]|nr:MAG: mitochondrial peripheral inner membrane protein [Watsoniomyces obsoletus]
MGKTTAPTPDQPGRWIIPRFGPPEVLEWKVFDPLPTPSNNQVLIATVVSGIGGVDNVQRAGGYPDPKTEQPGFTPGYDFVGEVVSLGPDVPASRGLSAGDRVTSLCMLGGYGTHVLLPVNDLIKLRPTDDPIKFCALPLNYMTAYGMLKRAGVTLPPGSSILIGSVSGGVGTAVAQLVRAFDMDITMYGTCSPGKFDFVKSLGVTPIDRHIDDVPGRIRELTGGQMVDVAYEIAGAEKSVRDSYASIKEESGRLIGIGAMAAIDSEGKGMVEGGFNAFVYLSQGNLPRGSFFAVTHDYYFPRPDTYLADFEEVAQKVRDGKLDPFIGQLLPLSEAVKANQMLVSGVGVIGKMEFIVDAELAKAKKVI